MQTAFDFLRYVPMFADLSDADLMQICYQVEEVELRRGEILFEEGNPGKQAYVIKEGTIEIYKHSNGKEVQLSVRVPGEIIGEMSLLEDTPRTASGRALTDSKLISLSAQAFDKLLDAKPSIARTMLHTVTSRLRSTQLSLNQSEKMAQLGTLTAGIAHELNNPASAVMRGAEQFKQAFDQYHQQTGQLSTLGLSSQQRQVLEALSARKVRASDPLLADPLARNDRESEFEDWLDEQGVEDGWELAPRLADLGLPVEELTAALAGFSGDSLALVIRWIAGRHSLDNMLDEISQGAARISEIVRALKTYVYLDQSPVQEVSIPESLENTLVILRHKLSQGVKVIRKYDEQVPLVQAYGSELNQVWTNIIDNAIDAMDGQGSITLSTRFNEPWVVVDIADTGPGIPAEIQPKLFSPFFTTKAVGKGTGLGLHISYNIIHRHGGDIKVISQPGDTHFEVRLPVGK